MNITADTAQALYPDLLDSILRYGTETSPRGQATKELTGVRLHIPFAQENLIAYRARKLNYYFSIAEWLWILLGQNDVASISRFNSKIADFSDDEVTFSGAYGPKFTEQLPYLMDKFRQDANSRQGVITLWRERPGKTKDVPCTVAFQYLLRDNRLHAFTYMRSNDAWLGFPYDLFNFTQLQAYIAAGLKAEVGSYTHFVGSLHLYDWAYDGAQAVIDEATERAEEEFNTHLQSPELTFPLPLNVRGIFNGLAQPDLQARKPTDNQLAKICETAGPPWSDYLKVLAHRTHRSVELPEPWSWLVPEFGVGAKDD